MTRFRDLLAFKPGSTPGEEQRRASAGLPEAVRRSLMKWWKDWKPPFAPTPYLLIAIAPYSQYDLTLLEIVEERLASEPAKLPVFVANVLDFSSIEELNRVFPGVASTQTPLTLCRDLTGKELSASGKGARDAIAEVLGLSANEITRQIQAEAPSYRNSPSSRDTGSVPR